MSPRKLLRFLPRVLAPVLAAVLLLWAGLEPGRAGPLTENGTQPGLSRALRSPGQCANCHGDFDTSSNHEPWPTWAGSLMAQSGRDPLFWASLDVANHDIPDVGDFCLRCHAPQGWLEERSEPPSGSTDGCLLDGPLDGVDNDFSGLHCHFCHRMMINPSPPAGQLSVYTENGQYWIDDSGCGGGGGQPCRHGPYDYPADGTDTPPHQWVYSAYMEDSQMCGNCHNVTNPAHNLIVAGVDTGVPFPVERTYMEWQQSDFAVPASTDFKTCQNCHMPDATLDPAYACNSMINNHTGDLPIHQFAGGNAWMPEVLRLEYPNLGRDAELTATRNWSLDMLQNQSATVTVTAPASVSQGGPLDLQVRVTNLTGHKLPTGYPEGRRMWLHVEARDGNDALIWESGAYDSATGDLLADGQLKVYEIKPGIWNHNGTNHCDVTDSGGTPMFHFVLNNCIYSDNRIPPQGFTGGGDVETQPVGYAYPETSPGSGILVHWDDTPYHVTIPAGTVGPVTVTATLRYQTTSREYVEFLDDQATAFGFPADCIARSDGTPTVSRGALMAQMWQNHGRSAPVDMDAASDTVTVTAAVCGDGVVNGAEACDDGGESATCDADCTPATCGDGTVNTTAGETCDDSGESATCDTDCTAALCGDGHVNASAGEACDDGNTVDGDGCEGDCTIAGCGDGVVNGNEACDDGNLVNGDGCDANCTVTGCGNGIVTQGEACDDGGETASCDADCTVATCGDGTVNTTAGETCDDGNTAAGDGCDGTCRVESVGDAGVPDGGIGDAGIPGDDGGDATPLDGGAGDDGATTADGGGTPAEGNGGCGCRTPGGDASLPIWLLGWLWWIRRRRASWRATSRPLRGPS